MRYHIDNLEYIYTATDSSIPINIGREVNPFKERLSQNGKILTRQQFKPIPFSAPQNIN